MDPFQQLPEIRYVLEIDDTENQLQLSCLLWELLGDTVASIITTTNTLIIIGNIYIMINCWTLLLELYIYPLNLPPQTQIMKLILYLYSYILHMRT